MTKETANLKVELTQVCALHHVKTVLCDDLLIVTVLASASLGS